MCPQFKVRNPDQKLVAAFRRYIIKKHGKLYGNLDNEFNNFILQGLALADFEDFSTKVSFLSGPGGLKIEQTPAHKNLTKKQTDLLNGFEKYLNGLDRFSDEVLIESIEKAMKIKDPRSVKGWIKYLIRIKFIRKDSLLYWTNTAPVDIYDIYPELAPVEVKHD